MIPKIIHYCWFGGKKHPDSVDKCIESWKKYCSDYEIKEWNETNFNIGQCEYSKWAYLNKKWAFLSDYARYKILYEHGGVYLDTDVELIQSIDDIVTKGPFMGIERQYRDGDIQYAVASGLGIGAFSGMDIYRSLIDDYETSGLTDEVTVVTRTTEELKKYGYENKNIYQCIGGIHIYPSDYFSPWNNQTGEIEITKNTRSIHHYDGTWLNEKDQYTKALQKKLMKVLSYRMSGHVAVTVSTLKYDGVVTTAKAIMKKML